MAKQTTQFVKMTKDGEEIEVSPLVVENHKQLGWTVVETPPSAPSKKGDTEPKDDVDPKDEGKPKK